MVIIPEMIGSVVGVYNGKTFNQVEIKPDMIGHYLAEFSISCGGGRGWLGGEGGRPCVCVQRSAAQRSAAQRSWGAPLPACHRHPPRPPASSALTTTITAPHRYKPVGHGRAGIGSTTSSRFIPLK